MESPAPGILLIADPFLKDPNFMRTVVFLCEHQDEGSFGFVLNKNYDYTLDELVSGLDDLKKIPVYLGGPVQMDTIHFLHQYPDKIIGGYEIIDGVFWGGNFETAIDLIVNVNQYGYLIMDHFHEPALDREECKVIAFVFQDFYLAGFQGAHQRGMTIQHFEQTVYSGQLHTVYFGAEQFLLWS